MSDPGVLIVFEGVNSVGKTTISRLLAQQLNDNGNAAEWLSFPGNRPHSLGALVYEVHHHPDKFGLKESTSLATQFLHIAAHLDAIESVIIPTLQSGINVILDRYWWSTLVYGPKDTKSQLILEKAIAAEKMAWGDIVPEALFLLTRNEPFDYSSRGNAWTTLQKNYLSLAEQEANHQNVFILTNESSPACTLSRVAEHLSHLRSR